MFIGSNFSAISSLYQSPNKQPKPAAQISPSPTQNSAQGTPNSNNQGTYDFSATKPSDIQGIAKSLFDNNQINSSQLFTLQNIGVPLGKVGSNGEYEPLSASERAGFENQPVNYLDSIQGSLKFLEQNNLQNDPKSGYSDLKSLLAILQNLQGQQTGVDISV